MAKKFLEMSPPVAASVKSGCPVVALETGSFRAMSYPQNIRALQEAEQIIWQNGCVPCSIAVIDGKIKAGLTTDEMESVLKSESSCARGELPVAAAQKKTAAVLPSAALAVAKMLNIVPIVIPNLHGHPEDIDALTLYERAVFTRPLMEDIRTLLRAKSVPVTNSDPKISSDAWLVQRELEAPECLVNESGAAIATICTAACETAVELKKKTDFGH